MNPLSPRRSSHSGSGETSFPVSGFGVSAESMAVQQGGRIVLGGLARGSVDGYGLARVNP